MVTKLQFVQDLTLKITQLLSVARAFIDLEALIWATGLAIVAISNPESEKHFTLFWPQWVFGIQSPGYGLGHSVGYLFRGDLQSSLDSHILGAPTVVVLLWRIVTLQYRKMTVSN